MYNKTCVKRSPSKNKNWVSQDLLSLNAGQKYCRMHSAILLTFIKLPFVVKIFVLSILEWPFYTGYAYIGSHAQKNRFIETDSFEYPQHMF